MKILLVNIIGNQLDSKPEPSMEVKRYKNDFIPIESKYYTIERRPPLGLMYLASVLKQYGIDTIIIDEATQKLSVNFLINFLNKEQFLFIGFTSNFFSKDKVKYYIREIKKYKEIPIVVGGPGYIHADEFLNEGCDIVANGESENTILDIVAYFKGERTLESISGISFKKNGAVLNKGIGRPVMDLDSIPFPSYDSIKLNDYFDLFVPTIKYPFATIIASRGCPFSCSFCFIKNATGKKLRIRTPENVISEIEMLIQNYKIKYLICPAYLIIGLFKVEIRYNFLHE